MLAPGTVLQNRYRVVRQLGQGGMGTVYEAVDERLSATVALKETHHATSESLRRQFEREAQLLARLHHPALPRVSDHFADGEGQYLVMQFVAGEDLGEMLRRRGGALPAGQALRWGEELLDALDYLHTRAPPVIHRDIKPQNLKLAERGTVILLDFGLAKGLAEQSADTSLPQSVLGYTPNYAPLEQIQGEGTDARSDLYSLAATLHHLLTGSPPPDVLKRVEALAGGEPDPLTPAHELNPSVPRAVSEVLRRAMAVARKDRFGSASEMLAALRRAGEGGAGAEAGTVLLPPTLVDDTAPARRGRHPTAALEDSSRHSVGHQGGVAAREAGPSGEPREAAPPRTRALTSRPLVWSAVAIALLAAVALAGYKLLAGGPGVTAGGAGEANRSLQAQESPTAEGEAAKSVAAGRELFFRLGCVDCHGNKGEGKVGPALAGLMGKEVRLSNEVTTIADVSYIRESILVPKARVVAGYKPIMPSFQGRLTEEQVSQLVAFVESLSP